MPDNLFWHVFYNDVAVANHKICKNDKWSFQVFPLLHSRVKYPGDGIRSAILIQRLSGFICSPIGWLKSRNERCNLSIGLYMIFAPLLVKFFENLQGKWFYFVETLANIIPDIREKVSKIKCSSVNQQTLIILRICILHERYLIHSCYT